MDSKRVNAFTTGNPFLGKKNLEVSVGRDLAAQRVNVFTTGNPF